MTPLDSLRAALAGGAADLAFASGFRHVLGAGRSCALHAHTAVEFVFHPVGHGSTRLADGSTIAFGPGAVLLYPPRVYHEQRLESPGVDICVQVDFRRGDELRPGLLTAALPDPRLRREFEALATVHATGDPLRRAELNHRTAALLYGLAAAPVDGDSHAEHARDLIARDYASIQTVEEVAERLAISPDHLRHLFTERYGSGPGQWLLEVRIDRARDLLTRSRLPLADVAEACGFRSPAHLGAAFRRATGVPPMRWRRQHGPADGQERHIDEQ